MRTGSRVTYPATNAPALSQVSARHKRLNLCTSGCCMLATANTSLQPVANSTSPGEQEAICTPWPDHPAAQRPCFGHQKPLLSQPFHHKDTAHAFWPRSCANQFSCSQSSWALPVISNSDAGRWKMQEAFQPSILCFACRV